MAATLFLIMAIFNGTATLLGLYRPWWVFWWSDFSNRKKVLKYYGLLTFIFSLLYIVVSS